MTKLIHKINQYCYLGESAIHSKGLFAATNIKKGTRIIQYKGELISKEEGTRREEESYEISKKDPSKGATYIFEIDEENDLDGNKEDNYAMYINHSCNPNCKYKIENKQVWIYAKKNIKEGEEICFDYEFDFDHKNPQRHPCKCGTKNCAGYIIHKKQRHKLIKHLKEKKK